MVRLSRVVSRIAMLAIALLASPSLARPVLFIPKPSGFAWWAQEFTIRPMGKEVLGISVREINGLLSGSSGMRSAMEICFVDVVRDDSIQSSDRATQEEIDATLAEHPGSFSSFYRISNGTTFRVFVVAFEECGGEAGTGILIVDEGNRLRGFIPSEFLFTRILKRDDGVLNIFGCYACGDVAELRFDPEASQFYLRWVGH